MGPSTPWLRETTRRIGIFSFLLSRVSGFSVSFPYSQSRPLRHRFSTTNDETLPATEDLNTTNLTLAAPIISTYYNHTSAQNGRGYNASTSLTDAYYIAEAVLGDTVQEIPRRTLLALHANNNATPTWSYKSLQRPPLEVYDLPYYGFGGLSDMLKEGLGVAHASDLSLIFGDVYGFGDASEGDIEVAGLMQEMWINFISDLNPNGDRGE